MMFARNTATMMASDEKGVRHPCKDMWTRGLPGSEVQGAHADMYSTCSRNGVLCRTKMNMRMHVPQEPDRSSDM